MSEDMRTLTINIPDDRGKLYDLIRYPAGEIQVRLTSNAIIQCFGKVGYTIVANPIPDLIELAQLKSALDGIQSGWRFRKLELPYLPYGRADRRFVPGDCDGLGTFATLLNLLKFDVIYTFDVHSSASVSKIENLINLCPIYHYDQITPVIKDIGRKGLALIAPDKGASIRYDLNHFKLPILEASKTRDKKTGKLSGFKIGAGIKDYSKALIVDDICDGGGTFVGLAEEIHRLKPEIKLYLYVSHGIFSQGFEKLDKEFKGIYISDFSFRGDFDYKFEKI